MIPAMDHIVELRNVSKRYGNHTALESFSLAVGRGEFLTLLGPSGSGKTTLLRLVAGFEQPESGEVLIDGKDASSLPPYHRNVNTVFQHYALFPHLTVYGNVAFRAGSPTPRRAPRRARPEAAPADAGRIEAVAGAVGHHFHLRNSRPK
ncbi:MAG: hypothetical protein DMG23_07455 [Acidobacteria bacterium]|nr:MAG: hypothetical protein DMG23_07455 [Acidobacteriota bacterium]